MPPALRPRRRRRTARVLVIDDQDRLLLFRDSDPGVAGRQWWMTPGGGVDDGETDAAAAVRELAEETGLRIGVDELTGPMLVRAVLHGYSDIVIDQQDVWFGCRVASFEVDLTGHTEEEKLLLTAHRWWTRPELESTSEEIWPVDVLDLWVEFEERRTAAAGGHLPTPPRRGEMIEESTVPVE